MKMLVCPLNGLRNISEFTYGGELREMPDSASCSDLEWAEYVFFFNNDIRVVHEWWLHNASGYWFIAERHTATDKILTTYDPSELFSQRIDFSKAEQSS